jgi:hypothetical protein
MLTEIGGKFIKLQIREIKITPLCTLTALHIAIQVKGLATSVRKGSNSIFQSEHQHSPLRFVTFSSLPEYRLMLQISQDHSPSHPFQCIIHYHLIKINCKQNQIYQAKIRNRGSEKIWKYNIKRILGK